MRINSSKITLIIILSASCFLPAFGQSANPSGSSPITVMTDKSSYSDGDQVSISGTVSTKLNVPISIVIKGPSQNIVTIGQVSVNADNTYSTQMVAGGRLWTAVGTYEVDVTYGSASNIAKTTFAYTGTQGMPGNMTGGTGNQTIPEFGPMVFMITIVSIIGTILISSKLRFRF